MKERLIGIAIGVAACAALALAYGFRQDADPMQEPEAWRETTYCYQLFDRVKSYNNEGGPWQSEMYLLDSCTGATWLLYEGKFEPVSR